MNKKFVLFLLTIIIGILYLFSVDRLITSKLVSLNNSIKSFYINSFVFVNESINKYFNQLDYIDELKKSNDENQLYKVLYEKQSNYIKEINQNKIDKSENKENYQEVKVISYHTFNDHTRVILDVDIENRSNINALITYDGYSAGIVLSKFDKTIAYLNQNKKSNYTVYIGEENAPGITSGTNYDGNIIIKYVPIWKNIKLDDEVITSSMDSIFPYGIKVGKVVEIINHENTNEVIVQPYAKTLGSREFYLYSSVEKSSSSK